MQESCIYILTPFAASIIIDSMNPIQRKLLELADTIDLGKQTAYSLSKRLEVNHPFKITYAIEQLIKNGYLIRESTGSLSKPSTEDSEGLLSIPYYGEVNCGQALAIAEDTVKSFLRISPSMISATSRNNLFALKARGHSMNQAKIQSQSVKEGDYVIAQRKEAHQIRDGDYVISLIGGAANLKRFHKDSHQKRIVLFSESTDDIPPIIISERDADEISEYQPIALVVDIIKGIPSFD